MNWDAIFEKNEEHFGFKLHDWQKDYISMKTDTIPLGGRRRGKTFAFIVRHLLNYENKLGDYDHVFSRYNRRTELYQLYFPCDTPGRSVRYTSTWYVQEVIKLDKELKCIGLETCFI